MKVLHLTVRKRWFDMIASGEKREEYRDLKPYWKARLEEFLVIDDIPQYCFKVFDRVQFKDGYNKPRVLNIEFKGISVGIGRSVLGANMNKQYIIKLGKIIK